MILVASWNRIVDVMKFWSDIEEKDWFIKVFGVYGGKKVYLQCLNLCCNECLGSIVYREFYKAVVC